MAIFISVEKIFKPHDYQRAFRMANGLRVFESMKIDGFWENKPLLVYPDDNGNFLVASGQHRLWAAKKLGLVEVPCVVLSELKDSVKRANRFRREGEFNELLAPEDYWQARFAEGDKIANILYKLDHDPGSFFYQRIAIKGEATKKTRFTINESFLIINIIALEISENATRSNLSHMLATAEKIGYGELLMRVNLFLKWFFDCFGKSKKDNRLAYKTQAIYTWCFLFRLLNKNHWLSTPEKYKGTVNKIQNFTLTPPLFAGNKDSLALRYAIVSHLNKGKKSNLLPNF